MDAREKNPIERAGFADARQILRADSPF